MSRVRRKWRRLLIIAATIPLLEMSCLDISQRAIINGFFDAAVPWLDQRFEQRLEECFADWQLDP